MSLWKKAMRLTYDSLERLYPLYLFVSLEEEVEEAVGDGEVWGTQLRLLPQQTSPG